MIIINYTCIYLHTFTCGNPAIFKLRARILVQSKDGHKITN